MPTSLKHTSRSCQEEFFAARNALSAQPHIIGSMRKTTRVFVENLRRAMAAEPVSARALAERTRSRTKGKRRGISDRMIGNYLHGRSNPSLDKMEVLAKALGYQAWQMMMPDFQPEILKSGKFNHLYRTYIDADKDGRRLMETQAEYVSRQGTPTANDPGAPDQKGNGPTSSGCQ
jgi:transcriptional regulator with XRE-family HTH domain